VVFFNRIVVGAAELAAGVIIFYGGPAGLARFALDGRGAYSAVQAAGNRPGKVAVRAVSSLLCLLHRVVLFFEGRVQKKEPPIIGRTCAFASKNWGFFEASAAVSYFATGSKKKIEIGVFSAQVPAQLIEFRLPGQGR
jgi:hypothetical protein